MTPFAKNIGLGWAYVVISIAAPLIAFFAFESLNIKEVDSTESLAKWFQRTGAVLTIFAIYTEVIIQNRIKNFMGPIPSVENLDENGKLKFQIQNKIQQGLVLIFTVGGTVIWGFGDLIYTLMS